MWSAVRFKLWCGEVPPCAESSEFHLFFGLYGAPGSIVENIPVYVWITTQQSVCAILGLLQCSAVQKCNLLHFPLSPSIKPNWNVTERDSCTATTGTAGKRRFDRFSWCLPKGHSSSEGQKGRGAQNGTELAGTPEFGVCVRLNQQWAATVFVCMCVCFLFILF